MDAEGRGAWESLRRSLTGRGREHSLRCALEASYGGLTHLGFSLGAQAPGAHVGQARGGDEEIPIGQIAGVDSSA